MFSKISSVDIYTSLLMYTNIVIDHGTLHGLVGEAPTYVHSMVKNIMVQTQVMLRLDNKREIDQLHHQDAWCYEEQC